MMREETPCVVGPLTQIRKGTLIFVAMAWWVLFGYRLSLTIRDNTLSPDRVALVTRIIEGYDINVAKILSREIHDRVLSTNINLALPFLLI